jgi:DNA-binding response OmpR family regulator
MTFRNSADTGVRILIAENGGPELPGLTRGLEARGYRVASVTNGPLALEMTRRQQPALVICDLAAPDINGSELCAQMKRDPDLAGVPVILLITLSDPQDVLRALECGADDFVIKPCDAAHVLRRVQSLLADDPARAEHQPATRLDTGSGGGKHFISAYPPQILRLLLSTCEAAMERNRELGTTRALLHEANQQLRSLAVVPEDRAKPREREPAQDTAVSRSGAVATSATGRRMQSVFALRSLRVLLVDDDPSLIESLRSALQDEGHKVAAAGGGQAGIDAFRDAQKAGKLFDVVITDLRMPYVDGRQVVASIRAMSPGTPIILLTGWGQHAASEGEQPPQVDRLLGKPPRIRELRAALSELAGRRATDRLG